METRSMHRPSRMVHRLLSMLICCEIHQTLSTTLVPELLRVLDLSFPISSPRPPKRSNLILLGG